MSIPTTQIKKTITKDYAIPFITVGVENGNKMTLCVEAGVYCRQFFPKYSDECIVQVIFMDHKNVPPVFFKASNSKESRFIFDGYSHWHSYVARWIEQIGQTEFETASGTAKMYADHYLKQKKYAR